VTEPKGTPAGSKRGQYSKTGEPRSPYSVNRELAAVRTVLRYANDCDLMPRASKDDIGRAFQLLPKPQPKRAFLKPSALQKVLEAAQRFDDEYGEPHAAPFTAIISLIGLRLGEARTLRWSQIDLDAIDASGKVVGEIQITIDSKTHTARDVSLREAPMARTLLAALRLRSGGKGLVFGIEDEMHWQRVLKALREHGAPQAFTWQSLRATCGTIMVNSPGIPLDAWAVARQLGHSLAVSERHYLNRFHGIDSEAKTIEAAMQIEDQVRAIIADTRQARKVGAA
jgi:integrase